MKEIDQVKLFCDISMGYIDDLTSDTLLNGWNYIQHQIIIDKLGFYLEGLGVTPDFSVYFIFQENIK